MNRSVHILRSGLLFPALLALALVGCCATPPARHVTIAPPCPPRPVLPKITETELAPLSDRVYDKVVRRDADLRNYAEQLELVCKTMQEHAK